MVKNEAPNKDTEYQTGYKKPPRHSRFQPGKSGNPNGRPRKTESIADVLQKELNSLVPIVKDGKRRRITMLRAIVKQHLNKAAAGDGRAAAIVFAAIRSYKPNGGDNLVTLLQEFRALQLSRSEAEQKAIPTTTGKNRVAPRRREG